MPKSKHGIPISVSPSPLAQTTGGEISGMPDSAVKGGTRKRFQRADPEPPRAADRKQAIVKRRPSRDIGHRDRILRTIEDEIIGGGLRPGERLDERAIAKRFQVSRTPVREALNRLASIGLIHDRGRQGSFVATITILDLFQIFEVMSELEGLCARLAARRMSELERQELKRIGEEFAFGSQVPAIDRYSELNIEFHKTIYRGTHNPFLEEMTRQMRRRVAPYRRHTFYLSGRISESAEEHRVIAEAICVGDAERAYAEMRSHVDIQRAQFSDFIALLSNAVS